MKEKLLKDIKKIAEKYDWLIVDDKYTKDCWVSGNNATYNNIVSGGGKVFVIDTNEIKNNRIIANDQYNTLDEFVEMILEYWDK